MLEERKSVNMRDIVKVAHNHLKIETNCNNCKVKNYRCKKEY